MRQKEQNTEYMNKYRFSLRVEKMREKRTLCNICWEKVAQTLHHKDENQSHNENSNLLPVCSACHLNIVHESDNSLKYEEKVAKKPIKSPFKAVTQGKSPAIKAVTPWSPIKMFKKGNIVIRANTSVKTYFLFESLGFIRY